MKIFQEISQNLAKLGLSMNYSARNTVLITLTSSLMIFYFGSTFWFSVYESKTFIEFNEALFVCVTSLLHLLEYIVLFWEKSRVYQLINRFAGVIQPRLIKTSVYRKANEKIEKWSSLTYRRIVNVGQVYLLPNVIVSLITWIRTDYSIESFRLPYPASFPYDWRTPFGYLFAVCIQTVTIRYVCTCLACITSLYIAFCEFLMTFILDIEQMLNDLDSGIETTTIDTNTRIAKKLKFIEIIRLHADAKQLGYGFVDIFDKFVMNYFLNGIITMCTMLGIVQMAIDSGNLYWIASPFAALIAVLAMIGIFCLFGDDITRRFEDVAIDFFHSKWYLYPAEMRRAIVTIMIVAQKPIHVRGLGIVYCTRELFKKTINIGFSCFMLLRQFKQ